MSISLQRRGWSVARCVRIAWKATCTKTPRRFQSTQQFPSKIFRVSEEIAEAVHTGKPVVALETTIYTHGFPYPDNVALASHLESVVRINGGIPATIGVLRGIARVGLAPEELIELASSAGKKETMKVSRRDLPYITGLGIAGKNINGGTTIAGTMILAHLAGIEIFGTGGLGGVHRGGETSMDISADLTELGRTPVTVISSGCKSFLDIPRTLEYLETQGVSVATFADGRTGNIDLPAFWTRESGIKSPSVVQNEKEAAAIIYARKLMDIQSGLFFANPIPQLYSIPKAEIDRAIEEAVHDAQKNGVHGHENTPFILSRIKELTVGKSIPANRALIESNVARATKVAVELSFLSKTSKRVNQHFTPGFYSDTQLFQSNALTPSNTLLKSDSETSSEPTSVQPNRVTHADVLVVGSVAVDLSCDYAPLGTNSSIEPLQHTSNPAVISQAIGGVGHNVATAAHLVGKGLSVRLCSVVASDLAGRMILSSLKGRGLDATGVKMLNVQEGNTESTAQYISVNGSNKELLIAMADMRILSSASHQFSDLKSIIEFSSPEWVVVDANWDEVLMLRWMKEAKAAGVKVAFEPVSVAKSTKLFPQLAETSLGRGVYPLHEVDLATPNEDELIALHDAAKSNSHLEGQDWWTAIDGLGISSSGTGLHLQNLTSRELVDKGIPQRMIQLLPFIPTIITKLGAQGVVLAMLLPTDHPLLQLPTGAPYILSRNVNGDANIGGIYIRLFPPAELVSLEDVVSVNGVGDTFLGVLVAGLAKGFSVDENLINVAQKAAVMTLKSKEAVNPNIGILAAEFGNGQPAR